MNKVSDVLSQNIVRDSNSPLAKYEKQFVAISQNNNSKQLYSILYKSIYTYLEKISNPNIVKYCTNLLHKNIVFVGRNTTNTTTHIYGSFGLDSNKLGIIMLDNVELGIDINSGECSSINDVVYIMYFLLIRSVVAINFNEIKKNTTIINYVKSYYTKLIKKKLNLNNISGENQAILSFLISYFFNKFILNNIGSYRLSLKDIPEKYHYTIEAKIATKKIVLEKYSEFRKIFTALYDFDILQDSPNKILSTLVINLKLINFLYLTSTLESIIGIMVISQHYTALTEMCLVSENDQINIEKELFPYLNRLEYSEKLINTKLHK